jgi:hypothetical protein
MATILLLHRADAQKLVRFSNVNKDSVQVQSLQGLSITFDSNMAGSLCYFREMRIGKLSTFTLSGEAVVNRSIRNFTALYDDEGYNIGTDYEFGPGFYLRASAEYRLYFNIIKRAMKGKSTLNNTGLYFSMPLTVMSGIINPSPHFDSNYGFTDFFPYLKPAIGYRYAFSKSFLMEADIGMAAYLNFNYGVQFNPVLTLKGAYIIGSGKK